eukprot:NODE_1708_length_554_cov_829.039604_g1377_i0.p1 GENE.NODE_1708_length_554_cov_829.039604_g1377_i0~~NODE_1708_length_554_cov_829.039604_g1377_i0.p1  ORF type:complete len:181 (+),score=27.80 NODE_1708_length_554_cov_829.039604_g1377_i0:32-544(+)
MGEPMAALPHGWDDASYAELTRYVRAGSTVLSTPALTFAELPDDHLQSEANDDMTTYLLALKQRMRKATAAGALTQQNLQQMQEAIEDKLCKKLDEMGRNFVKRAPSNGTGSDQSGTCAGRSFHRCVICTQNTAQLRVECPNTHPDAWVCTVCQIKCAGQPCPVCRRLPT